jgi:DNA topoisomerase-1
MDKVNAQQARRLLDRIVGYQLSPLLQQKIGKGLSAGRVQSVAVKLIVDRELEIRAFIPEESWRIGGYFTTDVKSGVALAEAWAKFNHGGKESVGRTNKDKAAWLAKHQAFAADLFRVNGAEFKPTRAADARRVADALGFVCDKVDEHDFEPYAEHGLKTITLIGRTDSAKAPKFTIADVQTKRTQSRPNAPFTTAALQQAASSALGFAPSRTMRVAQQLYEGIDLGGSDGQVGLITYMRTDSTNLSQDSLQSVRGLIGKQFGDRYLPERPNVYGNAKRAQEAHEAIRPSDATRTPQSVHHALNAEQNKLYDLIWRRFVACQMTSAEWDSTTVLVSAKSSAGEATFKATGRRLIFDGFLRVMGSAEDGEGLLPELKPGSEVAPLQIDPEQNYTSPPPRYTEAALVKKMEAEGIGRPSTYAAVIQTIQDRNYGELIDKRLHPTARGEVVTQKLVEHFPAIMDIKFTSYMEEELDKIEEAHLDWVHVLREFYDPFKAALDKAQVGMEKTRAEPSEYVCDVCGRPMVYRLGKNGRFLSCSGYPECKTTLNVDAEGTPVAHIVGDVPCAKCGKPMILRKSRMGPFLGCSGYPECESTQPCDDDGVALTKVKAEELHEKCGDCGSEMAVKWSRGRSFLGCTNYPKCKATKPLPSGIYIEKPKPESAGVGCDKCGRPMVIRKSRRGPWRGRSPRRRLRLPGRKMVGPRKAIRKRSMWPRWAPRPRGSPGPAPADRWSRCGLRMI